MEFIDTHTHITDEAFDGCREEVLQRALSSGVTQMLLADIDSRERPEMLDFASKHTGNVHPMMGLYPGSVDGSWREELDKMTASRGNGQVAVGEIGLDYHFSTEFKEEQKEVFRIQLELASEWDLPVNIHLRDATEDFFRIIEDCRHLHLRGNLHAFSGSAETFRRLRRCGDWSVGLGGVLTFKRASIAVDAAEIPMDCILLETDAPYLTPTPHRGERNESSMIPFIAAKLAEIKGISLEEVAEVTTANAKRLFNI